MPSSLPNRKGIGSLGRGKLLCLLTTSNLRSGVIGASPWWCHLTGLCFKAFLYSRKEIQFDLIDQPHQPVKKALGNYSNQAICFLIETRAIPPQISRRHWIAQSRKKWNPWIIPGPQGFCALSLPNFPALVKHGLVSRRRKVFQGCSLTGSKNKFWICLPQSHPTPFCALASFYKPCPCLAWISTQARSVQNFLKSFGLPEYSLGSASSSAFLSNTF